MNRQEISAAVIATSQLYNEMALSISQKLLADLQNNKIDFDHFMSVNANVVRPLTVASTKMLIDSSIVIIDGLDEHFQAILEGSTRLKDAINKIDQVEKIIQTASLLLSTAALIVTFVAAPNLASATAAVSSVGNLVNSLKSDSEDAEE
ncbi:hypothetical protein LX87_02508 [Larkinella arboricola]|uniref:Uncharacterized protein n=1 Tax=Larkinella arboricola TaxID=643671 RepID=A0A327WYY1_LARAB|nr:hypothetical protein [Larkinella arboricola]RAJ97605.1 hypothetical protein LX87_02508 [Larkinella arboricola]